MSSPNSSLDKASNLSSTSSMNTRRGWRFVASFTLLCILNLACAIDATILPVALPTIAHQLNGTTIQTFWAGTSFLLTSTVFQPTWASFSHIIDRKSVLMVAVIIFTVGSTVCSIAKDFTTLLGGRCIQGAGGNGITTLTYVIVTDMVSLRERGKWFGMISLQWCIGAVVGPVLGGLFAESNWRWIFWLNLPFCGIGLIGIPMFLRLKHRTGKVMERMKEFDWFGSVLFVAGLTCFLVPMTWGGVNYPWTSYKTLLPLILGVTGLFGFIVYSRYFTKEPLIRGSIFSTTSGNISYLCTAIHGTILWSVLYYMPLYFEAAKGFSPIVSGVALFPFTLTLGPSAVIVSFLIAATGRYRPSMWLGWLLAAMGTGMLILLKEDAETTMWVVLCLIPGFGYGILYPSMSFAVQAPASDEDLPFAAAMFSFFRSLGQTLGVAIGGVVFQNTLLVKTKENPLLAAGRTDVWSMNASALVEFIKSLSDGSEQLKEALINVYVDSLREVWIVMCGFACVAFTLSICFTKDMSLDRDHVTEQGFDYGRKGEYLNGRLEKGSNATSSIAASYRS